jgi:hypothetical protein
LQVLVQEQVLQPVPVWVQDLIFLLVQEFLLQVFLLELLLVFEVLVLSLLLGHNHQQVLKQFFLFSQVFLLPYFPDF